MFNTKFYVSVTLTTPENIRKYNKEYRNIDKETDVLSFPMFEKSELPTIISSKMEFEDVLGDMIISIERVKEQAKEYGHSFERELAYMVVHSFYHLMGEDHMEEEERLVMRKNVKLYFQRGYIQHVCALALKIQFALPKFNSFTTYHTEILFKRVLYYFYILK